MKTPNHVTLDRRVLARLAYDPCSAWNWYETAKAHGCRDIDELGDVVGDWLVWGHMDAAMSGLGMHIDKAGEPKHCTERHQALVIESPVNRPTKVQTKRRTPALAPPSNGVVEL